MKTLSNKKTLKHYQIKHCQVNIDKRMSGQVRMCHYALKL